MTNLTLSYKNSFKFGYNGQWFNSRTSDTDVWSTSYDPISRSPADFKTECVNTAKLIRDTTDLPLDVLFSGGQDSEVVVSAFIEAGIPINVIIMRFADGYNAFDIAYAIKYCEVRGITPKFVDLNIMKFLESDAWDYAANTLCTSPPLLPHLWLIDQCDNYVVIGSGDVFLYKNIPVKHGSVSDTEFYNINQKVGPNHIFDAQWYYREHEMIAALHYNFIRNNRSGCPGFFQFNPEIVLSWLNEPEVADTTAATSSSISTFYTKYDIYNRTWNTQFRPKFDGFEIVRLAMSIPNMRQTLENLYKSSMQTYKMTVDELRNTLERKV